jgi:MFS family permease
MTTATQPETERASWVPMLIVMLAQIQISFNAWNVSITGITQDLSIPPTAVGTALTTGTFAMASFVLLGAKVGAKIGVRRAFQIGLVVPALAAALIAVAQNGTMLIVAQAMSGASFALSVPALTVMVAANYHGRQQAQAIGFLASAIPLAQVISLLIAGAFASTIGWRWSFALVAAMGGLNFLLSWRLKVVPPQSDLKIDGRGAVLSSVAVLLISLAFSGLNSWGLLFARADAPVKILGLSPVPILLIIGAMFAQGFFMWTRKRMDEHKPVLFSLKILERAEDKATVWCMAIMLFVGTAVSFLLPLYMQVVQGFGGFKTSLSIIPYTLSIVVANTLVARLYDRFPPRKIARAAFVVVVVALTVLAYTISNDWGQISIVVGLVLLGLAQGCIVALVFNTLLSASPKELAGDVGAWRGLTHNISGSVGIAVATAFAIAMLGAFSLSAAQRSPVIDQATIQQVEFDNVNFITNDQLQQSLSSTTDATPAEIDKATVIFADARLRSLKITLLVLAAISLLAIVPAGRMPTFQDEEIPVGYPDNYEEVSDGGTA